MSILRMFQSIEENKNIDVEHAINTPDETDIVSAADRWLSTLKTLHTQSSDLRGLIRKALNLRLK